VNVAVLPPLPQGMVHENQCHHGFCDGHSTNTNAGIMPTGSHDFRVIAIDVDAFTRQPNTGSWFEGKACSNRLTRGDPAENTPRLIA
jgi:hypothetical protein